MKNKLKFSNKVVANLFLESQNVEGSIEEQSDGSAILSYAYCDKPEKASVDVDIDVKIRDSIECVYSTLYNEFNWMNSRIDDLWREIYEHKEGHLPAAKTPSQMQKAVDMLGMGEDYEVQKKVIYASKEIEPFELK